MSRKRLAAGVFLILIASLVFPSKSQPGGQPVRMAYLQNDLHHLALWIALDKGFFIEEGVSIEVVGVFRAGAAIMAAFGAGDLDMAYVGESPTTIAAARGATRVQVLAQANTEGTALVVSRSQSSISGLAGLRGKTVAMPGIGTVQDFLLRKALRSQGVDEKEVNIMVMSPAGMLTALQAGQIDAFIAWEPYPSKAETMGIGRSLVRSRDIWQDHPCCVLAADQEFLKARPLDAQAVVRAHVKATKYIREHADEAVAVAMKYTGMDEATIRAALKNITYTTELSLAGEEEFVRFLSLIRYIKISDPQTFMEGFIDRRFLQGIRP